ncbi:MAG: oligopeptidase A, partial [Dokdonella sp.]
MIDTDPQTNPLLVSGALPHFSAIGPEHVEPAIDAILADYRADTDALLASTQPHTFASVILRDAQLSERLAKAWSPVGHLHGVMDSEALRKAYAAAQEKIVAHASELGQNRALYAAV